MGVLKEYSIELADERAVSLAECAVCQDHGEWTRFTERSLRSSRPQQGEMPLAVCVRHPEPRPRNCGPIQPNPRRCECSWLEGLRTVLDRVIDSHEQRGAPYLGPAQHVSSPKGSGLAGTLESQQTVIELITTETAKLSDCVGDYEEKGRLGQVADCRFVKLAVGAAFGVGRSSGRASLQRRAMRSSKSCAGSST